MVAHQLCGRRVSFGEAPWDEVKQGGGEVGLPCTQEHWLEWASEMFHG